MARRSAYGMMLLGVLAFSLIAQTSFGYRGWAVGQWRLWQYYTEYGRETTFTATVNITRNGGMFSGSIYYDSLGKWEPLENIIVTDNTLQFTRPMHGPQIYSGQFNGQHITGSYRDMSLGGEWPWRAEKQ